MDAITLSCMADPCILVGTGQIYCLASLRTWLANGSRVCPKSNIQLRDVQVVRLPSLRSRIAAWRGERGLPPLPPLDPPPDVMLAAGEEVPGLMQDLRCGDVYKRGLAAGQLNNLLIRWGQEAPSPARQQVMEVSGPRAAACAPAAAAPDSAVMLLVVPTPALVRQPAPLAALPFPRRPCCWI